MTQSMSSKGLKVSTTTLSARTICYRFGEATYIPAPSLQGLSITGVPGPCQKNSSYSRIPAKSSVPSRYFELFGSRNEGSFLSKPETRYLFF